MNRRHFMLSFGAAAFISLPAMAQDHPGSVIAQLRKQGFRDISQEVTLLGRVRILANRSDGRREIILNPKTGEILRDLWMASGGSAGKGPLVSDVDDKGKESDDDNRDDDDDRDDDSDDRDDDSDDRDDDDDDRDDDDNSGSGKGD